MIRRGADHKKQQTKNKIIKIFSVALASLKHQSNFKARTHAYTHTIAISVHKSRIKAVFVESKLLFQFCF